MDTCKKIKQSRDKRRPGECPIIYLKRKDDTREFWYHDQLMASCFMENYDTNYFVHHMDNDITNCKLSNLYIGNGYDVLKTKYHEEKEWCKLDIGQKLYYDYYICEDGRLYNSNTDSFILPFKDKRDRNKDYSRYNLYYGKSSKEIIHVSVGRLVALHFLPVIEGKDIVIYRDGDLNHYYKDNLYWGDRWDAISKNIKANREFDSQYVEGLGMEKWKEIYFPEAELEDEYLVSNFGRVWNKTKKFYSRTHCSDASNRNNQHYRLIVLLTTNGFHDYSLHRVVAYTFVKNPDPDKKMFVNHINGNPECNLAINLEWCTPMENVHHAIETNLTPSRRFINIVDSENWRLNTLLAWIYSFKEITDEEAYKFYVSYRTKYNDNIPALDFETFVEVYKAKLEHDTDFIKINNYYAHQYLITTETR